MMMTLTLSSPHIILFPLRLLLPIHGVQVPSGPGGWSSEPGRVCETVWPGNFSLLWSVANLFCNIFHFQFGEELIREFGLGHHPGHGLENRQTTNFFCKKCTFFTQAAARLPYCASEGRTTSPRKKACWTSWGAAQAKAQNPVASMTKPIWAVLTDQTHMTAQWAALRLARLTASTAQPGFLPNSGLLIPIIQWSSHTGYNKTS